MDKRLLILVLFFWNTITIAQPQIGFGNYDPFFDTTQHLAPHSLFRPYDGQNSTDLGYGITKKDEGAVHTRWYPVVNSIAHTNLRDTSDFSTRLGLGAGGILSIGERFYVRGALTASYYERTSNDVHHTQAILPNTFLPNGPKDELTRNEIDAQFRASYTPNKFFTFQAGIDNNFIGEGNRSLFQGDHIAPAPFAKIKSTIWRIQFVNLYQLFRENLGEEQIHKYAASHMVNFQITERFQFGLFESVVFQPRTENWKRGFEIEYLNPFLFYRPQAYSIGSQDRLVIGSNMSYNFGNTMLYGQFLIDDFSLNEVRANERWWASKYAGQLGIKGKQKIKNSLFTYLSELNFVRPFTYSHVNESTTYGHQGLPLAHPLGANFIELYLHLSYHFNERWKISASFMNVVQGGLDSTPEVSYGNNIFTPYTKRPKDENSNLIDYGYVIGENGRLERTRISFEVQYMLVPKLKLTGFVRPIVEVQRGVNEQQFNMLFLGIRTDLWNERSLGF